jgi:hypothetical protein
MYFLYKSISLHASIKQGVLSFFIPILIVILLFPEADDSIHNEYFSNYFFYLIALVAV